MTLPPSNEARAEFGMLDVAEIWVFVRRVPLTRILLPIEIFVFVVQVRLNCNTLTEMMEAVMLMRSKPTKVK